MNTVKQLINNYSNRKLSILSIHVNKEPLAYKALEFTLMPSKIILITPNNGSNDMKSIEQKQGEKLKETSDSCSKEGQLGFL